MEVGRKESGEPFVILHGGGQKLLQARGARHVLISLTHTQAYAAAVAVLGRQPRAQVFPSLAKDGEFWI